MGDDLADDLQVSLVVQGLELLILHEWPAMVPSLHLDRFARPCAWGPTMAGKFAREYLEVAAGPAGYRPGTSAREAVLVGVAGMIHCAPLANDPSRSMTKFFGHALSGLDRKLGFATPPELMDASLPYVADVAAGDLYRIALRASKQLEDRTDLVPVAMSAFIGAHAWPQFFGNLTLKQAWL